MTTRFCTHGFQNSVDEGVTCPTTPVMPDGTLHTVIGCGSTNVQEDEFEPGLYDCIDCGVFFTPEPESEED